MKKILIAAAILFVGIAAFALTANIIVLVAAAMFLPFDRTISAGLVLGAALYYVYLRILPHTVTAQLEAARDGRTTTGALFFVRMLVLALPLLLAAKFPQHLNIFAAFMPLFVNHLVTFAVYGRREAMA